MAPLIQNVYAFESVIIINNYLNLTKLAEKRKEWNTNWVRNDSFSGQLSKSILFPENFLYEPNPFHEWKFNPCVNMVYVYTIGKYTSQFFTRPPHFIDIKHNILR